MKVVDGGFGKSRDPEEPPYKRLLAQLEKAKLEDLSGEYLLIWDSGDSLMLLSNIVTAAEVYMQCAKAQTAVMATQFSGIEEDDVPPAS
jgi:hypothetical protein